MSGKIEGRRVVAEVDGKPVGYFKSILAAAYHFNLSDSCASYRFRHGVTVGGLFLRPFEEGDENLPLLGKKTRSGEKKMDNQFKEEKFDNIRYKTIHYETLHGHICITPCPFQEEPRPKIGSGLCMQCGSNHGRNRKTQEVACSHVMMKEYERDKH